MWPFAKKVIPIQKETPELYLRCNELPIHNFNEIATNSDFSYLKKNRNDDISNSDLEMAWITILDEYFRISKNTMALGLLKKKCGLIYLEKKLQVFEALKICIDLKIDVSEKLKEYRINNVTIDAHIGMIKNDISRIFAQLQKEEEVKQDNQNFDKTIAIILKNGYQINRHTTVVSEWVQILNLIEQSQKTNK